MLYKKFIRTKHKAGLSQNRTKKISSKSEKKLTSVERVQRERDREKENNSTMQLADKGPFSLT